MAIGAFGVALPLKSLPGVPVTLAAGQTWMIPQGTYWITPGPYTYLQMLDPIASNTIASSPVWRNTAQAWANAPQAVCSDGGNFRLANIAGCAVGAVVTTAGSGYTAGNPPTFTPSAGGSKWRAIIGGALGTSPTVPTQAGSNYTYPPNVLISAPSAGGLQATATATLTSGAVSAINIINQGAGYVTAPTALFITDERDPNNPVTNPSTTTPVVPCGTAVSVQGLSVGGLAVTVGMAGPLLPTAVVLSGSIVASPFTLTGAGTVVNVVCIDPGSPVSAVPTFTVSSGSAAATMLMNFSVTSFTVAAGGAAYGNAQPFDLISVGGVSAATPIYTNPAYEKGITQVRMAQISGTSTAGGAIQTTGSIVVDGGIGFQLIPSLAVLAAGNSLATTIAQATAVVGGAVNDTTWLIPTDS